MYKTLKTTFRASAAVAVLSAGLITTAPVQAGTIVQCGAAFCSSGFAVTFNGSTAGGGEFVYDAKTGDITLSTNNISGGGMVTGNGGITWNMADGSSVSVDSLSGNADPVLGFALSASTGATGSSFGFAFNLPIALSGPINADSKVTYSLTSTTATGAQITAVGGKVVTAFEGDTSPGGIGFLNKGVDVGDTFGFTGVDSQGITYSASNSFTGNLAYDLMAVNVNFALSANSLAGITGFVQQTAVPVPAAVWLFGSGLLGLVGIARRKVS